MAANVVPALVGITHGEPARRDHILRPGVQQDKMAIALYVWRRYHSILWRRSLVANLMWSSM